MNSGRNDEDPVQKALETCKMTQSMVEITAKSLDGLRKQCTQNNDLIQSEILEKESKIIKLFSRQLVAIDKLKGQKIPEVFHGFPDLEQLMGIIGINHRSVQCLKNKGVYVQDLLEVLKKQGEHPIAQTMKISYANEEETRKLCTALHKLKRCTDTQLLERKLSEKRRVDLTYSWSNYQSLTNSPKLLHHSRPSTSSLLDSMPATPTSPPTPPASPAPSPIHSPSPAESRKGKFTPPPTPPLVKMTPGKGKFPTTPPPQKKNKLHPDAFHSGPLTKSKSHDSQLPCRVNTDVDISKYLKKKPADLSIRDYPDVMSPRKKSFDGLSGNTSPLLPSPKKTSPPYRYADCVSLCESSADIHPNKKNQLSVPPVSPRSMMHSISHRFQTSIIMGVCDMCNKHIFLGKVCKYCKAKFHKDCAVRAAPACGLPSELIDVFRETIKQEGSPGRTLNNSMSLPYGADGNPLVHAMSVPAFQDHSRSGSATSSCTSSTPSSPAPYMVYSNSAQPSPSIYVSSHGMTRFDFPDVNSSDSSSFPDSSCDHVTGSSIVLTDQPAMPNNADVINTNTSNDSDKSDKTLIDTGSSSDKAAPLLERVDSLESTEDGQSLNRVNSISVTLREWDIPYESLKFGDELGEGRFGTVYRGNWHGDVAIKMIKMDPTLDNQAQLQAFKQEVAMLRKTRHENLVLFMGACMKPPKLAIVTSLCRGKPLYNALHSQKEKYNINRAVIIASQIAQGMGYLHAKNIIHKDLKSKNVFLEMGKVVITDFGLFSLTKLCHSNRTGDWLYTPVGWLCYLAPEIMRKLTPVNHINADLPFSRESDIYAFGTIWYEIVSCEFPHKKTAAESIIWRVGSGIKQSLTSIQASKDVKDLLMMCWNFSPEDRPDFPQLMHYLEKLPKKRLARSPSHPVHLSRSAESVF